MSAQRLSALFPLRKDFPVNHLNINCLALFPWNSCWIKIGIIKVYKSFLFHFFETLRKILIIFANYFFFSKTFFPHFKK